MNLFILSLFILSLVAGCIEVEIAVPSFPEMATYFQVPENLIQLTVAYNFIGFCLTALIYGPLSERYGRRLVMITGNTLLFLGSLGCVLASSIEVLLLFRFIQGLGASASAVIVFTMIADIYYKDHQSIKIISLINTVLTILMATAPIAGSFISQAMGWWGNYVLVVVICAFSLGLQVLFLPETKKEFSSITFGTVVADYKRLLTSQRFMANSILPGLLYGCYIAFVSAASFLYIETFGMSTSSYALHQGATISAFTVINLLTPLLIEKFKKVRCLMIGLGLCGIGLLSLVFISLLMPISPYFITAFMMVFCMGFAICYPATFADSLEVFPEIKGISSSAGMSLRMLICAACVGGTSYLFNGHPISLFLSLVPPLFIAFGCFILVLKQEG